MKKVLPAFLCVLLVAVMALALVACGGAEEQAAAVNPNDPKTDVSVYRSGGGYGEINDPLTWDKINAFPVVHDGMTIEEGRKLVVDFFRFCKMEAIWMPSEDYEYVSSKDKQQTLKGSEPYAGLPYITQGTGNIYRLMDYMDPETHVVDVKSAGVIPAIFGNQCGGGSYVGMGRVINSATYDWTKNMTPKNGFVPVGEYTIDREATGFSANGYNTIKITEQDNAPEVMYESYAGLVAGDVVVYYTTAGHVVMISGDAHVEYDAAGKIDPKKSYVTVIDQTPSHGQATNAAGDTFNYEKNVDVQWTFESLLKGRYVPYTFAEWLGTDPIESSKTEYTHTGETITIDDLFGSKVNSNYGIFDIYAYFYNANGVEVAKVACRAPEADSRQVEFKASGGYTTIWGQPKELDCANYEYTVKIVAQLSTGERPVIWEGKLAK